MVCPEGRCRQIGSYRLNRILNRKESRVEKHKPHFNVINKPLVRNRFPKMKFGKRYFIFCCDFVSPFTKRQKAGRRRRKGKQASKIDQKPVPFYLPTHLTWQHPGSKGMEVPTPETLPNPKTGVQRLSPECVRHGSDTTKRDGLCRDCAIARRLFRLSRIVYNPLIERRGKERRPQ